MGITNVGAGNVRPEESSDPRTQLAREKFFTLRPKPLEQWIWRRRIPAAAERVFWFHWCEGARGKDWCSQFALQYVAQACTVDISTVTRAYQTLTKAGLIRRTDPGRDPTNKFQQATAVTEVLLPRELVGQLSAFPNRPRPSALGPELSSPTAAQKTAPCVAPAETLAKIDTKAMRARHQRFLSGMSDAERSRFHRALCASAATMDFDPQTHLSADLQTEILGYLATLKPPRPATPAPVSVAADPRQARRVSVFDLARLRRELQRLHGVENADAMAREVLWAVEEGALRKFAVAHAINIALKKLRLQEWTRPHRMPPNWMRSLGGQA
jgi:hypothetical protein